MKTGKARHGKNMNIDVFSLNKQETKFTLMTYNLLLCHKVPPKNLKYKIGVLQEFFTVHTRAFCHKYLFINLKRFVFLLTC